jgi:RecA/RadA recombinase
MVPAIPLTELMLRPSTLQRFTKRGFESVNEIEESRLNGGINLLASELDVSLQEAAGLIREVQGCLSASFGDGMDVVGNSNSSSGTNDNVVGNGNENENENPSLSSPTQQQQQQQQQQQLQSPQDDGILTAYDLLHMHDPRRRSSHAHQAGGGGITSSNRHVVSFCKAVDKLLGGGVSLGQVTEISGLPGTGKTQLATQLSVLARLPREFGGVEGRTLYVDAEGSFVPERAYSMADALCDHVRATTRKRRRRQQQQHSQRSRHGHDRNVEDDNISPNFAVEDILDSIDVFRVHDETALLATLYSLQKYVKESQQQWEQQQQQEHEQQQGKNDSTANNSSSSSSSSLPVRLIVIDSIAFHFRAVTPTDSSYYAQRTKTLTALAAHLGDLASKHDLAVVVINQMTTKVNNNYNNNNNSHQSSFSSSSIPLSSSSTVMVPALGESWAHATATRLLLSNEEQYVVPAADGNSDDGEDYNRGPAVLRQVRSCTLIKSAHRPTGTAQFHILEMGIRDAPDKTIVASTQCSNVGGDNDTNKRPRTF